MIASLIRALCLLAVRLYFKEISVQGQNAWENDAPTLVVANHPNGLLDPLIVQIALHKPIHFLAKSTLFGNIFGRTASKAFGAIPVYRTKDGNDTSKNVSMFDAVYDAFGEKKWVVIFPEGISHDESVLLPLKTGAARMVLGTKMTSLQILPIGITYENKGEFRSRVNINFGELVNWDSFKNKEAFTSDKKNVLELTDLISAGLKETMFEAPSEEIRRGLFFIARWMHKNASISTIESTAKSLEKAYGELLSEHPQKAQALADSLREFADDIVSLGLDPWNFELDLTPTKGTLFTRLFFLLLSSPLAALGLLFHYPTYAFINILVKRMAGEENDLLGTLKTLGGLIFFPLSWILLGILFSLVWTWPWGIAFAFLMIPLSFFTLAYIEAFQKRRRALSSFWLRKKSPQLAKGISSRRDTLMTEVSTLLELTS